MSRTVSRTIVWKSMYVSVVISPRTRTRPVVVAVSQATRAFGSSRMMASRIASEIWSHILSGWPSVTDSDVNRYWAASTMLVIPARVSPKPRLARLAVHGPSERPRRARDRGGGGPLGPRCCGPAARLSGAVRDAGSGPDLPRRQLARAPAAPGARAPRAGRFRRVGRRADPWLGALARRAASPR